jgi:hypothetical protein
MKSIHRLIFLTLVTQICSSPRLEWTDSTTGSYYNYSGLNRDYLNPWVVKKQQEVFTNTYMFNFGSYVEKDCKGSKANVIENMEIMGHPAPSCSKYGYMEYATVRMVNPANPNEGIMVTYGMGDSCYSTVKNRLIEKETNFFLYCSEYQDQEVRMVLIYSLR